MNHDDINYRSTSVANDNLLRVRRLRRHLDLRTRDNTSTTVNRQPSTVNTIYCELLDCRQAESNSIA